MSSPSSTITEPAVGTYRIDPATSVIRFTTRHMFGTGKVTGVFSEVAGEIVVAEPLVGSTVTATAPSATFHTGTPKRDDKVKSPQFLDPERHPHLTFRSTELARTGGGLVLRGDLTVVGGTAPLELVVTEMLPRPDGVSITATGTVDRYAHGITAMKGMTGRRLQLVLDVHAVLA